MIHRILFPTDGSAFAERALPTAAAIAAAQGAEIFLVRVTAPPAWLTMDGVAGDGISPELYQQVTDELHEEAHRNLDRLAGILRAQDIKASVRLLEGSTYAALLDYEAQVEPELVIMATHGHTGLARFALGSVADVMVREGTAPVLLVRSFGKEVVSLESALVPLDGSALAEQSLPLVETLAGKPLQRVFLLSVVDTPQERADAWSYLIQIVLRLANTPLHLDFDVQVGRVVERIAERARRMDLVMMATHGRGGFDRLRHGSVATAMVAESPAPVLLVRARAEAASAGALAA
ncbi:MAG TPA: universal stress protein [Chloroflexota bacterium]|nr:universal stress protein [Chloroflexota bacterium]